MDVGLHLVDVPDVKCSGVVGIDASNDGKCVAAGRWVVNAGDHQRKHVGEELIDHGRDSGANLHSQRPVDLGEAHGWMGLYDEGRNQHQKILVVQRGPAPLMKSITCFMLVSS